MDGVLLFALLAAAAVAIIATYDLARKSDRIEQEARELRRLLDARQAHIQSLAARLRELTRLAESPEASQGAGLRLDEHGNLEEKDDAGNV